jgi:hypothetical protein
LTSEPVRLTLQGCQRIGNGIVIQAASWMARELFENRS